MNESFPALSLRIVKIARSLDEAVTLLIWLVYRPMVKWVVDGLCIALLRLIDACDHEPNSDSERIA